jgi:hypothetical protein
MRFLTSLILITTLELLVGCYNPREIAEELQFAHQRPLEANLVGKWVPTPETLKDMRDNGEYVISIHELLLNSDGSFSMKNMPDWWRTDSGQPGKSFESAAGKWRISLATGDSDWVIELVVGTAIINTVHVRNQRPPYLIHIGIGDPDNGHYMLFERLK